MLRTAWLLAPLLALPLGCDPVEPGDPDASAPTDAAAPAVEPRLEIGTGAEGFGTFEDGETLDIVSGCQGAQHIWVALRVWGLNPRGTILDVSLARDRDEMVVSQTFRVRVSLTAVEDADYADVWGLTLVVPEPDQAVEEDLTLRATVTAMDETSVSASRPIRAEWNDTGGCFGGEAG
jgi:hypothetical protein